MIDEDLVKKLVEEKVEDLKKEETEMVKKRLLKDKEKFWTQLELFEDVDGDEKDE